MKHYQELVRFIRQELGCGCADEVFEQIECEYRGSPNEPLPRSLKLIAGAKLLILIYPVTDITQARELLPELIQAGRNERDREGLNRFRLVFLAKQPLPMLKAISSDFERLQNGDSKLHLHVVDLQKALRL